MRVIIAGSRDYWNPETIIDAIKESGFEITTVVEGEAPGVDTTARIVAENAGIPVASYPADWDRFGKAAGPIRNTQMAKNADALIALWRGDKGGTWNMIKQAVDNGLLIYIKMIPRREK